jgi:Predicted signal-transduction protein containing cAMP-binding and CBS domains
MPLKTITIATLLNEKSEAVYAVGPDATVEIAVAEMNRQRIGSVLIKEGARLVGIFTERDVLTRIVATGKDPKSTPVREVMTADFLAITADTRIEEAMQLITERRVRHLPVLDGDRVAGLISIGDITRWLLKINQMEAENLRRYAFGDYPG